MNLPILLLTVIVYLTTLVAGNYNIVIAQMLRSQTLKKKSVAGSPAVGNILYCMNAASIPLMMWAIKPELNGWVALLAVILVGVSTHVFSPASLREFPKGKRNPDNSSTEGVGSPSAQPAH